MPEIGGQHCWGGGEGQSKAAEKTRAGWAMQSKPDRRAHLESPHQDQQNQDLQQNHHNYQSYQQQQHGHNINQLSASMSCAGGSHNATPATATSTASNSATSSSMKKELLANGKKTKGRVRIKMEFIHNKLRRYTTFSKRKTGIMKKVSKALLELSVGGNLSLIYARQGLLSIAWSRLEGNCELV